MPTRRKHRGHRPPPPFDERAAALRNKREIVDRFGMWEHCGRWACWRARCCRSPGVACFDEQRGVVEDLIVDEAYANYRLAGIAEEMLPDAGADR
jgi:hypothetical protein